MERYENGFSCDKFYFKIYVVTLLSCFRQETLMLLSVFIQTLSHIKIIVTVCVRELATV